jgi:hypothetical protein
MKKQDKNINNENDKNKENRENNFKNTAQNIIGAIWEHENVNGGKYWKGKIKSLDENGNLIYDSNGNIVEFNVNIFYNKWRRKDADPTMIVYKPERDKYQGKDYDKYKKKIVKEVKIKEKAVIKNIKKNEDKLKEIDI